MTNSFLILFITIKTELALILQGVSINTHSAGTEKKRFSLHFSNSFPSSLPHTHLFCHLSFKKNILKEVKNKREKKILYNVSFSLITTHTDASHFISLDKQTHKNIIKGAKK